jgi:hypothetical protein
MTRVEGFAKKKKKLSATDERDIGAGDEELKMTMRW